MVEFASAAACIALAPAADAVTVAEAVARGCACIGLFGMTTIPLIEAKSPIIGVEEG